MGKGKQFAAKSAGLSYFLLLALLQSSFTFAQQSNTSEEKIPSLTSDTTSEIDPYESFNRTMYQFNDHIDNYLAKPISDTYLWVTPSFVQLGVSNFFSNLKDINVVLNDHMQGKFLQGAEDTGRIITNTTFGFFGFFDIASKIGLPKHEEDFGQTLAVWGVPQGSYLVLPILGPTTFRGVPGGVFDIAANPTSYVGMPAQLVSMLNTRASADGALKFINDAAIDPYVFTREAFLQNQQHLISDGKVSTNVDVMPLEDDLFNDTDNDSKDNQVQAAINTKTATIPSVDTETDKAEKDSPPLSLSATTLDRSTTTASVDTSVIQPTKGKVKHLHHSKKSEAIKAEKSKSTKQD